MELVINGEPRSISDGTTVAMLLEQLKVQPERVVVEVNLNVLKRAQHATAVLRDGDQVEIVHFVGGGSIRLQTSDFRVQTEVCGLWSVV